MLPFSWDIYLLTRFYEPLNFLFWKFPHYSLLKKLAVSSEKYQYFILLGSVFSQKCLLSLFHELFTSCSGITDPWCFCRPKLLCAFYQKKLVSSSLRHQCVVLLLSTFCKKLLDFDQDNFWHFRVFLKQKGQSGKKIMNNRNLMPLKDVNHHIVSRPEIFFWIQGDALNRQLFKVSWPRQF